MRECWINVYRDPRTGLRESGCYWPKREWAEKATRNEFQIDGKPTLYRIHVTLKNPA